MSKICSITLIVYGRLDTTRITFESLIKNTKYPYELIVVENRSDDETRNYLLSQQDKIDHLILNKRNLGKVNANNMAWRLSRGDYIATVENDIFLSPGWLSKCIEYLNKIPQLGLISPTNHELEKYQRGTNKKYQCQIRNMNGMTIDIPKIGVIPGTVVARREVIEQVGLHKFSGTLYAHSCPEYCKRMKRHGFLVAYPSDFQCDHIHIKNKTFDSFVVNKQKYKKHIEENNRNKGKWDESLKFNFLDVK